MLDFHVRHPGPICGMGALMKVFGIVLFAGGLAFMLGGYQAGLFGSVRAYNSESEPGEQEKGKLKAKFPEDLAPAARAQPVAPASEFKKDTETHRLVFLKSTGKVHTWQDSVPEAWVAERVEDTELAIVLGPQKKTFIDITKYPNGAPPISRYKFEVEASVVEAKTVKVVANRVF